MSTSTVAKEYNGKDLNGDGMPDYGSCIAKKKGQQSYWWIISIAGGLLQAKGTGQGAFFDTTNMNPLFNNDALRRKALETYKATMRVRPARRDQPRRRRHARPVHDRSLRADDGLGRHRHAGPRPGHVHGPGQGRRGDQPGWNRGARPRERQARAL